MKKSSAIIAIPRGYTRTGLNLPSGLVFSDWLEIGKRLQSADAAVQWWFGDWWAFGEAKYGERAAQAMDPDFPWALQSCMNAARVCRRIETSRRREVLSFAHHEAVAALEPKVQDELLDQAIAEGLTRAELRAAVHHLKHGDPEPMIDAPFVQAFEQWVSRVETDLDLLKKIRKGELHVIGFNGGRPVVSKPLAAAPRRVRREIRASA